LPWKKKSKFRYKVMTYLFPPLQNFFLLKARRAVLKKLENYIKIKNEEWQNVRDFKLGLWHSKDLRLGQLIVKHQFRKSLKFNHFILLLSSP